MIRELAELQANAPSDFVVSQLKPILLALLNGTLDVKKGLIHINLCMTQSKSIQNKVFWIKVVQVIKNYFEETK